MKFLILIAALVLLPCQLPAEELDPVLKRTMAVLEPILGQLEPKAEVSYENTGTVLIVRYLAQAYKVHGRMMTGEILTKTHDEIGPSFKGFVLEVGVQARGEANQAVTPQTVRQPYWMTDLDVTPVEGTNRQIKWGLSYGTRTNADLLSRIRTALQNMKKSSQ